MKQSPRNKTRANRLANALRTVKEYDGALDWPSTITDALSDLRHLCDKLGLSFSDLDRVAYDHYSAERTANNLPLVFRDDLPNEHPAWDGSREGR